MTGARDRGQREPAQAHDRTLEAFDRHADWLFGLFRLVLADRQAASVATAVTLAEACAEAEGRAPFRELVMEFALDRMVAAAGIPAREARQWAARRAHAGEREADTGPPPGIDDAALAFYVRTLPAPQRQVVALRLVLGVSREQLAPALGVTPAVLEAIECDGRRMLRERLAAHVEERTRVHVPGARTGQHLRPLGALRPDAAVVVRRGRVHLGEAAPRGLVGLILRIVERLLSRGLGDDADERRSGRVRRPAPPPSTPTTRPLERPHPTPSTGDLRAPRPTAGTGVHRRSPSGTPSTARLSNPRRPGRQR